MRRKCRDTNHLGKKQVQVRVLGSDIPLAHHARENLEVFYLVSVTDCDGIV